MIKSVPLHWEHGVLHMCGCRQPHVKFGREREEERTHPQGQACFLSCPDSPQRQTLSFHPEQRVGQQSRCARAKAHQSPRTPLGSSPPLWSPSHCRVASRTHWAIDQSRKCPQGHLHNKGGPKRCLLYCKYQALSPAKRSPGREAARGIPPLLRIPSPQLRSAFI